MNCSRVRGTSTAKIKIVVYLHRRRPEDGLANQKTIANDLGLGQPQVSQALKGLREDGYVTVLKIGREMFPTLTDQGRQMARLVEPSEEIRHVAASEGGQPAPRRSNRPWWAFLRVLARSTRHEDGFPGR